MKIKLYIPTLTITRIGSDEKPYTSLSTFEPCYEWVDAKKMCGTQIGYYQEVVENDEGQNVIQFKGNVIDAKEAVKEFIIDTDDFAEYKPSFEVELTVVETKTFCVELSAEQIEELGYDADEYGASQAAEEMFKNGDFDTEREDAYPDDVEVDADATELD